MNDFSLTSADHADAPNRDGGGSRPRSAFIAPAIGLVFFLLQIPFARLAFDSHHDGYMLAAAIGVRDGGIIHRDVFTLYGPLTPLIHATWLLLPLGSALALRIVTCALSAVTAALIADLGRVAPATWRLSMTSSVSAALLWIVLNDVWRGDGIVIFAYATLPWPAIIAAAAFALTTWLLARQASQSGSLWTFAVAGFLVGISIFIKLNIGAFALITTVITVLVVAVITHKVRRQALIFVAAAGIGSALPVAYLVATSAVAEYIEQSIDTPRALSENMAEDYDALNWLARTFFVNAILTVPILIAGAIWKWARASTLLRAILIVPILLALWLWANRVTVPYAVGDHFGDVMRGITWEAPRTWENFRFIHLVAVMSLLFAFATYLAHLLRLPRRTSSPSPDLGLMISCCLAAACLAQVYPSWDVRHFWWGVPLVLVFGFRGTELLSGSTRFTLVVTTSMFVVIMPMIVVLGVRTLAEEREPHRAGPLLDGMLGEPEEVAYFETRYQFVVSRPPGDGSALFLAKDGDLSVLTGHYRAVDADWALGNVGARTLPERTEQRHSIISDLTVEELSDRVGGTDYFIASRAANLTHLLAPPCIGGNCPEIEPDDVCMAWGSCRPRSTPTPLELVPDSSFSPITVWNSWDVKVNTGFSYPEDDGAWITGHHARLTFTDVAADTVRISLYPFLPPEWTHIDISVLTDSNAIPVRLNDGITTIDLPIKPNTWNELVFRCDTFHRPSELGLGEDERPLCAKILGFEPVAAGSTP